MKKEIIFTDKAPKPIGPYSQAVKAGQLLFISGQIPLDPLTEQLVKGDIEAQTRVVMSNIGAILQKGGGSFDNIIKTTIYLINISEFSRVNQIYGEFFQSTHPARSVIEVTRLPKGAGIEIEVIAHL